MKNSTKSSVQDFSRSVNASVPRSIFYRPSNLKTTFDAGKLVPVYIDEVLPGDTYKMKLQHVARTITPITPVMDNIKLEFFAFFVPNRIVWDNWNELMGENTSDYWTPASTPSSVPSYNGSLTIAEKKIGDYYGIPVGLDCSHHAINLLPLRGYYEIWNEWFRNQNVQSPLATYKGDSALTHGAAVNINASLLSVNKPFDYFTACLPEPQKGEDQLIPIELNTLIPVVTSDTSTGITQTASLGFYNTGTTNDASTGNMVLDSNGRAYREVDTVTGSGGLVPRNLYADGSGLTVNGTTIAELREAFQIQKLYERDARGGTRYVEMLKAHFGVNAGDYRLQRPEYLGRVSSMVNINQVAQTSETGTTAQGNLAAFGHSQGDDFMFNKSFVEHGFIHIFAVARQKKSYQQGLEKFWSRQDRLDYYFPVLAHISEQPVYTKEIYALADNGTTVFGYQEAWSDYRYKPNKITGQMRSSATSSFEIWHYADDYSSAPTLSDTWMQDNSHDNIERTLADQTSDQIKLDVRFDLEATRPIPVNSIPGYIDHF